MTTLTCPELCDVASELALGTLPGRERAAALAHLDECAECRLTVEELSDAADALLLAAPEVTPPAGFAQRVADGFVPRRPPRWRTFARPAAAAAAVLVIGAGTLAVTDRSSAPARFAVQAPGVRSAAFVPATGEEVAGKVFASADRPSWVFMTVHDEGSSDVYRCQVEAADGQWTDVGSFQLRNGSGSWGKTVATDVRQLKAVRLVDEHGAIAAAASFA